MIQRGYKLTARVVGLLNQNGKQDLMHMPNEDMLQACDQSGTTLLDKINELCYIDTLV